MKLCKTCVDFIGKTPIYVSRLISKPALGQILVSVTAFLWIWLN